MQQHAESQGGAKRYVLNVVAEDRPGIVAAVSGAVLELGGNIDACSQTVLSGYFTLIMIVTLPEAVAAEALRSAVVAAGGKDGFDVVVRPAEEARRPVMPAGSETFIITAFGEDRPGTIFRFCSYLAEKGVNIVDLYGNRQGERFVLISQVQIPPQWDIAMLQADLEYQGQELGFTVRVQHEDVFVATNELRLRREASGPALRG
jgi:glycine cleavage system transcriptional repressor